MQYKKLPTSMFQILIFGASNNTNIMAELQLRIDSLQKQIDAAYKPGLGEFMGSMQVHHAKLWFAGKNENWKLADFEIHEMMEAIDNIQKYQTERKESKQIAMINP